MKSFICAALVSSASAFPFVANAPGVNSPFSGLSQMQRRQQPAEGAGSEKQCPFNKNHVPAAPYNSKFPYGGAKDGLPGTGKGGYIVPNPKDTAHKYIAPTKNDIRGPCPGLNTAANHNFLARDGITTFTELVDAQQNVYNVGYDLALLLAALGLTLTDGDVVTEKLSIGCDATSRTSFNPTLTGHEPGLDGHDKFEADSSLTRNDFYLDKGDDFTFNKTLFNMMADVADGEFNFAAMSKYRYMRYNQSKAENGNFFFGPLALLLYGASSFLYELMPTAGGTPNSATIKSFFFEEKIPDNWAPRTTSYSNNDVTDQILAQYAAYPVLFGGNTADGSFDTLNFGYIKDGKLPLDLTADQTSCLLYQLATGSLPSYLNGILTPSVKALAFIADKVTPSFQNLGCPIAQT